MQIKLADQWVIHSNLFRRCETGGQMDTIIDQRDTDIK
jgi:hypothetical protein